MLNFGKSVTAALGVAALSGTLLVPTTTSFASSPAFAAPALSEALPQQAAPVQPAILTAPAVAPAPAVEPAEAAPEIEAEPARAAVNERELECMTRVMLYEAGNEGRAGQLAVGHVVLNRVRSSRFPDSVCGVIYQRGQFSSIRSFNHPRNARWSRAQALARDVLAGETESNVGSALYFHATRVRPAYVARFTRVGTVGNHVFYR